MADRGVLYMVWGDKVQPYLERSLASLRRWHPELPVHVERLNDTVDPIQALLAKARMFDVSPFGETLFLDADTVVLGRLDFAFERARNFRLACTINECPWARRYADPSLGGDLIEYNTGVLLFTRAAQDLFARWQDCASRVDSSIEWEEGGRRHRMPCNDQGSFAKAIEETRTSPFVLPLNWNYRPWFNRAFFGPIRVWHDYGDVPDFVLAENERYRQDATAMIRFYPVKVAAEPARMGGAVPPAPFKG
jgi:hypothetical protein